MPMQNLENRILELALLRGILVQKDFQITAESAQIEDAQQPGSKLDALIRAGRITAETVESLAQELIKVPLFTLPTLPSEKEASHTPLARMSSWKGYIELQPIGMGGGGMIYKAKDPQLERWVALKFPRGDQSWRFESMLREARAQARIDHPNIVRIYEVGEFEGQPFIAMQWVQGMTLWEARHLLTLEQRVRAVMQVAEGLHAAHQLGMIHLDIKPANILIEFTEEGEIRPFLTDFGLVKNEHLNEGPSGRGTPTFASPEQLAGGSLSLDRRSDVYSLGSTLYSVLVSESPFNSTDPAELPSLDPIPVRDRDPKIPLDLAAITDKCLRRDPQERYRSAWALAEDLKRFLSDIPVLARNPTFFHRCARWTRRNPWLAIPAGVATVFLLILSIWSFRNSRKYRLRTQLALRYGQEVQTIDAMLRRDHLSRKHDLRPTLALVRGTMARISNEMAELGPDARGPGSFALGQGYYALGDIDTAAYYLDHAWQAGFRTPACAQVRGQVLTDLYQMAREELRAPDSPTRQEMMQVLNAKYRDPALECFRMAQDVSLNKTFQKVMESYLKGDTEAVLTLADESMKASPWLYETSILSHFIHLEKMKESLLDGKSKEARAHAIAAGRNLDQALEAAPSDPINWEHRGWWCLDMADLPDATPRDIERWVGEAREAFDNGRAIDADYFGNYDGLAETLGRLADIANAKGQDPMEYLDQSVVNAEAGALRTPSSRANPELGEALNNRAEELLLRGNDPCPDLDRAIAHLRKCLERSGEYDVLKGLETSLALRGSAACTRGEDPFPFLREAIHWALESSKVDYANPLRKAEYLSRRVELADAELRLHQPCSDSLVQIVKDLETVATTMPHEPYVKLYLADALRVLAQLTVREGGHPKSTYEDCEELLVRLQSLLENDTKLLEIQCLWAIAYGEWILSTGGNPTVIFSVGRSAAKKLHRIRPNLHYPLALETRCDELIAKSRAHQGDARRAESKLKMILDHDPYAANLLASFQPIYPNRVKSGTLRP